MSTQQYFDAVQKLYISYYGRPADLTGLAYWSDKLAQAGGSLNGIINAFADSSEAKLLYGSSLTAGQRVDILYQNILGRVPDASGRAFYVDLIESGKTTLGNLALDILNGATGADALLVQNKMSVANAFTNLLASTPATNAEYIGGVAAAVARDLLDGVGYGTETVRTLIDQLDAYVHTVDMTSHYAHLFNEFVQNGRMISSYLVNGALTEEALALIVGSLPDQDLEPEEPEEPEEPIVNVAPTILSGPTFTETTIEISASDLNSADTVSLLVGSEELGLVTSAIDSTVILDTTRATSVSGGLTIQDSGSSPEAVDTGWDLYLGSNDSNSSLSASSGTRQTALYGFGANDTIVGSGYADIIFGGAGNDSLTGGAGNDTFNIGSGSDTVSDLATGDILVVSAGATVTATTSGFTDATSTTSAGTGSITLSGAGTINMASAAGTSGWTLNAAAAAAATITGSGNADTITGSSAADTINGGAGNDSLTGGAGNDTFNIGSGSDTVSDLATGDILVVSAGATVTATTSGFTDATSTTSAGTGSITLSGAGTINMASAAGTSGWTLNAAAAAAATITGSGNADTITGSSAADTINGGAGNDSITGGAGNDSLTGGAGNDTFNIGSGSDTVSDLATGDILVVSAGATVTATTSGFTDATSTTSAGTGSITLSGAGTINMASAAGTSGWTLNAAAAAAATITGSGNADTITGSSAADTINGGAGNDSLTGGAGIDTINLIEGTASTDTVVLTSALTADRDIISNFGATDIICFDESAFPINFGSTAATGGLNAADYNEIAAGGSISSNKVNVITTSGGYADYAAAMAAVNTAPNNSDAFVIFYNSTSGKTEIYSDTDADNGDSGILIAQLDITGANLASALSNVNFSVI